MPAAVKMTAYEAFRKKQFMAKASGDEAVNRATKQWTIGAGGVQFYYRSDWSSGGEVEEAQGWLRTLGKPRPALAKRSAPAPALSEWEYKLAELQEREVEAGYVQGFNASYSGGAESPRSPEPQEPSTPKQAARIPGKSERFGHNARVVIHSMTGAMEKHNGKTAMIGQWDNKKKMYRVSSFKIDGDKAKLLVPHEALRNETAADIRERTRKAEEKQQQEALTLYHEAEAAAKTTGDAFRAAEAALDKAVRSGDYSKVPKLGDVKNQAETKFKKAEGLRKVAAGKLNIVPSGQQAQFNNEHDDFDFGKEHVHLHHGSIMHDGSVPMLSKDVHVQRVDRSAQLAALQHAGVGSLRHVYISHDGSQPMLDSNVHLQRNDPKQRLREISQFDPRSGLRHVFIQHDGSAPHTEWAKTMGVPPPPPPNSRAGLLIHGSSHLGHTEVAHDASGPVLDRSVHVQQYDRQAQLQALQHAGKGSLRHVEVAHDASAPQFDSNTHIATIDRNGQLVAIHRAGVGSLRHVEIEHDGSAPHPEWAAMQGAPVPPPPPGTNQLSKRDIKDRSSAQLDASMVVQKIDHGAQLREISGAGIGSLKHVEVAHDGSIPQFETDTHITMIDRSGQLVAIQKAGIGSLKHVEIAHDASAPHPEWAKQSGPPPPPPGPAPKLDEL